MSLLSNMRERAAFRRMKINGEDSQEFTPLANSFIEQQRNLTSIKMQIASLQHDIASAARNAELLKQQEAEQPTAEDNHRANNRLASFLSAGPALMG